MAKDCRNCTEMIKGCWDENSNYCYRDKEEILPKRIDVDKLNRTAEERGLYGNKVTDYLPIKK